MIYDKAINIYQGTYGELYQFEQEVEAESEKEDEPIVEVTRRRKGMLHVIVVPAM